MLMLLVILLIYLALHLLVYFLVVKFFNLDSGARKILFFVLIFLSLGFILSVILVHFSRFPFFNYYYAFSAFWVGLVIHLALFLGVAGLGWLILNLFSLNPKMTLGILALIFSLAYSFFGVWNARHPSVKTLEVEIKNLPEEWKGKKAIQLSDLHLGAIQGKKFAEALIATVNNLGADIIFITGDLFDGSGADLEYFAQAVDKLKSEKGTYLITGNHEVYLGKKKTLAALKKTHINILENKSVEIDKLQIAGVGYPDFGEVRKPGFLKKLEGFQEGKPTILLYHAPASLVAESENTSERQADIYFSPKVNFTEAKESGVNLQLSGHTHNGQIFPFTLLVKFIYDGFNYGLKKDGDFSLYVTSGTGTWGPPMRTGSRSEIVLFELR